MISTLDQIAVVQESGFDWKAALESRRRAVRMAETVPDKRQQASTYRLLADTLVSAGRPREALPAFETCARLFGEAGNRGSERARALAALGTALRGLGEIRRARTVLDTALAEARAVKDRQAEGTVLTNLGNLAMTNGDLATALVLENEALAIFREVKDRPDELSCLNNIGAIYLTLGSLSRARRYVEDGLRMAEELNDRPLEAQARHNLGILLAEQGDLDRALEELKRSVGIRKTRHELRRAAFGQATVAETLLRLGRREEARKQLGEALAGLRRTEDAGGEAYALNVLGEMRLLEQDPGASLEAHRRALALAKNADLPDERWRSHAGVAAALSSKGRTREAREEIMSALSEVERVRMGLVTGS